MLIHKRIAPVALSDNTVGVFTETYKIYSLIQVCPMDISAYCGKSIDEFNWNYEYYTLPV